MVALTALMMIGCEPQNPDGPEGPNTPPDGPDTPDNPNPEVVLPKVTLTAGEATMETITFTLVSEDATSVSYTVVSTNATRPSLDDILASGTPVEPNKSHTITAESLFPGTQYIVMVAAKNGETPMNAPATLEMTTVSDVYLHMTNSNLNDATGVWWGKAGDETDYIMLQLATAEVSEDGAAISGGAMLRMYFAIPRPTDWRSVTITPGTYIMGEIGSWEKFELSGGNCNYMEGESVDSDWVKYDVEDALFEVALEDGIYTISGDAILGDENMSKIRVDYTGPIEILDYSIGCPQFTRDQEVYPSRMGGMYISGNMMGIPTDYINLTFFNVPVDADGYVDGPGYVFGADVYTEKRTYETYDFAGTYVADAGGYKVGTFSPGYVYISIPMGTVLQRYDENVEIVEAGLIATGEIVITRADGKVTTEADVYTDRGVHVLIHFDGDEYPLSDPYATTSIDAKSEIPAMIARPFELKTRENKNSKNNATWKSTKLDIQK